MLEHSKRTNRVVVLGICALFVVALSFSFMIHQETVYRGYSQDGAAINSTALEKNISNNIEQWVPFVVAMTLIGVALSALGIHMYRR